MKRQSPNKNLKDDSITIGKEKENYKKSQKLKNQVLTPKNEKQEKYIKAIKNHDIVVAIGSAGTSKTFIPSVLAADMFSEGRIDNIVICRPMEGPGRHIGTLPGDKNEKLNEWLLPVAGTIKKRLGPSNFEYNLKKGNIEYCALSQIKGRSFESSFIIADEAEDMDIETIKSLLTRPEEGCKLVINGDIKQINIKGKSGLGYLLYLIKKYHLPIPVIEFSIEDCMRHRLVKKILEVFEQEDDLNSKN